MVFVPASIDLLVPAHEPVPRHRHARCAAPSVSLLDVGSGNGGEHVSHFFVHAVVPPTRDAALYLVALYLHSGAYGDAAAIVPRCASDKPSETWAARLVGGTSGDTSGNARCARHSTRQCVRVAPSSARGAQE